MSTRCNIIFTAGSELYDDAGVFQYVNGDPESILAGLARFFAAVEAAAASAAARPGDTRFEHPEYLAARYIVWQSLQWAAEDGADPLTMIGLGVPAEKSDMIAWVYQVTCGDPAGWPQVSYRRPRSRHWDACDTATLRGDAGDAGTSWRVAVPRDWARRDGSAADRIRRIADDEIGGNAPWLAGELKDIARRLELEWSGTYTGPGRGGDPANLPCAACGVAKDIHLALNRITPGSAPAKPPPATGGMAASRPEGTSEALTAQMMGRDTGGYLVAFNSDGMDVRLSECCRATAKGTEDGICCRACYALIDEAAGGQPEPPYIMDGQVTYAGPKARGWGEDPPGPPYSYRITLNPNTEGTP